MPRILTLIASFVLLNYGGIQAQEWERLKNCRLIENESNDGDSFHVEHQGTEYIFRLYFADTPESEIDSRVADRVAEQAAHFGVTQEESLKWGHAAKKFSEKALRRPFTVVTRFQKAMGASKLQRYYAVILPEDGNTDLAEMLVEAGLARAYGQVVDAPKGKGMADYKRMEKRARNGQMGIYGGNKPHAADDEEVAASGTEQEYSAPAQDSVPTEDSILGAISDSVSDQVGSGEIQINAEVTGSAAETDGSGKINLNTASKSELLKLPGVGEVTAERIIQSRPYSSPDDLRKVQGLGKQKISMIAPFASF